jgi:hypothetical protein
MLYSHLLLARGLCLFMFSIAAGFVWVSGNAGAEAARPRYAFYQEAALLQLGAVKTIHAAGQQSVKQKNKKNQ